MKGSEPAGSGVPPPPGPGPPRVGRRVLFLDDDPARAAAFLAAHPDAAWVRSAAECVGRLAEAWDEVHLDHDLGGEAFVDMGRDDCGMEVVRWLCREPRPHLRPALFVVHTHNPNAACVMLLHLQEVGYRAVARSFAMGGGGAPPPGTGLTLARLGAWLRRCLEGPGPPPR